MGITDPVLIKFCIAILSYAARTVGLYAGLCLTILTTASKVVLHDAVIKNDVKGVGDCSLTMVSKKRNRVSDSQK